MEKVFSTPKGIGIDGRNLGRRFEALPQAAGLTELRWHDPRLDRASRRLAQRASYRVVTELFGHIRISLSVRSSHLVPERRQEAADSKDRNLAEGVSGVWLSMVCRRD